MNSILLVFQHLFGLRVYFISSIKLNYFLCEPGLDGKGPHNSVLQRERERKKETTHNIATCSVFLFFFFFWRKKLLIPTALNDGTAIRVAAFFALAASQRKTNKAARFRNLIRLWVPEQLKYYSWSASVNPPMESIYRWSLRYWWSVTGLFYFIFFFLLRAGRSGGRLAVFTCERVVQKKKYWTRRKKALDIYQSVSQGQIEHIQTFFFFPLSLRRTLDYDEMFQSRNADWNICNDLKINGSF